MNLREDIAKAIFIDHPDLDFIESGELADAILELPVMLAREAVCDASLRIRRLKTGTVEHNKAWADFTAAVAELDALEQPSHE